MIKGRDLLTLAEFEGDEIIKILDLADLLKKEREQGIFKPLLKNRSLAMIFQKPSTRTRVSFEVAMFELGGYALNLSQSDLQLARGESIEDTAKTLSRYVDVIMARIYDHMGVVRLAEAASVPVVNGLSNLYHPCQILADLQSIREVKGRVKGVNLAWIGDGNNVCNTLLIGCSKLGVNLRVATPIEYRPLEDAVALAEKYSRESGCRIEITSDPIEAVQDVDVVATDTFVSMGSEYEKEARLKHFLPKYQVNMKLMKEAKEDAVFMHCLPANRGLEVTEDVIDGPKSIVWDQAENRLHTEKALLTLLLLDEGEVGF